MSRDSNPEGHRSVIPLCVVLGMLGAMLWFGIRSGALDSELPAASPRPTPPSPRLTPPSPRHTQVARRESPAEPEPATAQASPSALVPVAKPKDAARIIAGRVRVGGVPASGVEVYVIDGRSAEKAWTDEQGRFELSVQLRARQIHVTGLGPPFFIERDLSFSQWVEIELAGGTLEGSVLDASGGPIPGIEVRIAGLEQRSPDELRTDEFGRYTALLPAGRYVVRAGSPSVPRYGIGSLVVNVPDRARVSADLILQSGGAVRGVVLDQRGGRVPQAEIRTIDRTHRAWTDEHGVFELPAMAPGLARIEAVFGSDAGRATATVRSGEIARTEVVLARSSELHIVSLGRDGRPVLPRRVSITDARGERPPGYIFRSDLGELAISDVHFQDDFVNDGTNSDYWTGRSEGQIVVSTLPPGTYTIRASLSGDDSGVTRVVEIGTDPMYEVRLQF